MLQRRPPWIALSIPINDQLLLTMASKATETQVIDQITTPHFNRSSVTRKLSITGLALSWCVAIACIACGFVGQHKTWSIILCWRAGPELIVLAQNIIITLCNESMGYVHSVSLRWALQRNGKLDFNSNLRLFPASSGFGPNAWYSNLIMTCAIVTSYGASSLTLLLFSSGDCGAYVVLGKSFIILGFALATQASFATWSLTYQRQWPTWSSDVMDVAAACVQDLPHALVSRPGRTMMSVTLANQPSVATAPCLRQTCAFRSSRQVQCVTYLLWGAVALSCVWWISLLVYISQSPYSSVLHMPKCWNLLPWLPCGGSVFISLLRWGGGNGYKDGANIAPDDFAWVFALCCFLQLVITMALHLAELHINCSRDESTWRQASTPEGLRRTSNALVAFLSSYQALILFCLKPFAHWIYSLTYFIDIYNGFDIYTPQVIYLSIVLLILATFSSSLVLWRHKGPQPATFGHLRTLVDLIDEWPKKDDSLFWGDRGSVNGARLGSNMEDIRHAGTHWQPLGPIRMDKLYE